MLCKGLYLRGVVCGSYVGLVGLLLEVVCLMGVWQLGSLFHLFEMLTLYCSTMVDGLWVDMFILWVF